MRMLFVLLALHAHLIPSEYKIQINLLKYLQPNQNIIWWESGIVDIQSGVQKVIFCSDPQKLLNIQPLTYKNTYFSNYFNMAPVQSFLVYQTSSLEIKYIFKVEEFKDFIGSVDNLAEAIFSASLYGYEPGHLNSSSRYQIKGDEYILYLEKIVLPPDVKKIMLNRKGKVINQNNNIAKIKVRKNGDVFEFNKNASDYKKLETKDMYRPL
jgi:hypothetical protein